MKATDKNFKKEQEEILFTDNSNLLKVTIGVFSVIFTVCAAHMAHLIY